VAEPTRPHHITERARRRMPLAKRHLAVVGPSLPGTQGRLSSGLTRCSLSIATVRTATVLIVPHSSSPCSAGASMGRARTSRDSVSKALMPVRVARRHEPDDERGQEGGEAEGFVPAERLAQDCRGHDERGTDRDYQGEMDGSARNGFQVHRLSPFMSTISKRGRPPGSGRPRTSVHDSAAARRWRRVATEAPVARSASPNAASAPMPASPQSNPSDVPTTGIGS
jgi:hypothetical protein